MPYMLKRWDYETHTYLPYLSPANKLKLVSSNMDEVVDCASCGNPTVYGETYTSKEIQNNSGLGYPVCDNCHDDEMERAKLAEVKK